MCIADFKIICQLSLTQQHAYGIAGNIIMQLRLLIFVSLLSSVAFGPS